MDKQVLAGQLVHDAELLGAMGIRTGKAIKHIQFPALQIGNHFGPDGPVFLQADGAVHLAPGNFIMNLGHIHNEFIIRGAARVFAGIHD